MNRRYQIFVSSTYLDLVNQRKYIIDELNKVGYIAIGMEQFPASDEDQMDYICPVIDESDYYIVIVKGKYGKPSSNGLSFTQREFEYAAERKKPTLAFIYRDFDKLTTNDTEQDPDIMKKFLAFKDFLMKNKIVRFWGDEKELATAVKDSLVDVSRRKPSAGWIRGDNAIDPKVFNTLEEIRQENADLKKRLLELQNEIALPDNLSHGDDSLPMDYIIFQDAKEGSNKQEVKRDKVETTWNIMLKFLSERIYKEIAEDSIEAIIAKGIALQVGVEEKQSLEIEKGFVRKLRFQYEALGLLETFMRTTETTILPRIGSLSSGVRAGGKTTRLSWRFSELGKKYVARLNAVQRASGAPVASSIE